MENAAVKVVAEKKIPMDDVFKTSLSGVTYFNPLNPNYENKIAMKHTASGSNLNGSAPHKKRSSRRKRSIKLIQLNNKSARCTNPNVEIQRNIL